MFPADSELTAETVEILDMDGVDDFDADLTFVELGDLDAAGHSGGSSGVCYATELMQQDFYVGQMLDAIISRPNFASTVISLTTTLIFFFFDRLTRTTTE